MPPVSETRLPAAAKQHTMSAITAAQTTYAIGAAAPRPADATAGSTKMPAPIVTLTMLAVSCRAPIARTSPASDVRGMRRDCTSKYNRRLVIHLLALLGVLSISFSAIFVRLSGASPVTATLYRGAYAAPVLLAIWLAQRSGDRRGGRER